MRIDYTDRSDEVLGALRQQADVALEKCGLAAEKYAKKLCPVGDTGDLRNSIAHKVDPQGGKVYIGSDKEYAPYVELGTGKYYPGGRPTPWIYQDAMGHWHRTSGQRAQPYLKPAVAEHGQTYRNIIENTMKGK